jgi:hypothetical protein
MKRKFLSTFFILVVALVLGTVAFLTFTDITPEKQEVIIEIDNARFKK